MSTQQTRDGSWHALADVRASIEQYVDLAMGGRCIGIRAGSGALYAHASRGDGDVMVLRFGRGGGFCWERQWPRRDLERYAETMADHEPDVCRGDREDILPRRHQ